MNIELPKDADGREIPLDTKVLYLVKDGIAQNVERFIYELNDAAWYVETNITVDDTKDFSLTPLDSWEKLEEDLNRAVEETNICLYRSKDNTCVNCTIYGNTSKGCSMAAFKDIPDRIRKLRGEGR